MTVRTQSYIVCDRCHHATPIAHGAGSMPENAITGKPVDLCASCTESLTAWFKQPKKNAELAK